MRGADHPCKIERPKGLVSGPLTRTSTLSVPDDLLRAARKRLAWLAALAMFSLLVTRGYLMVLQPIVLSRPTQLLTDGALAVLIIFSGLIMYWQWVKPCAVRNVSKLALFYGVTGALSISIFENCFPWTTDTYVHGVSWNTAWIIVVSLAVPNRVSVVGGAAALMAAMGPVGLWLQIQAGSLPAPTPARMALMYLPYLISILWSTVLSGVIYQLHRDVAEARDFGSYKLLELIGAGGMGEVWRAQHHYLARPAAVKLIQTRDGSPPSTTAVTRFEREARLTAQLRSPHTVQVYDFGLTEDGQMYYVMELLEGITLEQLVRQFGPLSAARAIYLLKQACESLAEAHNLALLHRDLKPGNLVVCRLGLDYDFVKVLDFGLAKSLVGDDTYQATLSMEGQITGTPAYMAPEMISNSATIDTRADIYSLGCVAYWLMTGQLLFDGGTALATAIAHMKDEPIPPSQRTELPIPADLEALIMRCLAKNPDERPVSAYELLVELERCADAHGWSNPRAERWWMINRPQAEKAVDQRKSSPALAGAAR